MKKIYEVKKQYDQYNRIGLMVEMLGTNTPENLDDVLAGTFLKASCEADVDLKNEIYMSLRKILKNEQARLMADLTVIEGKL